MKGICFKSFLTKQLIAGKKTMTRRTGGLEAVNGDPDSIRLCQNPVIIKNKIHYYAFARIWKGSHVQTYHCKPRYSKGSTVFIKEGYLPGYFDTGCTAYATDFKPAVIELIPKPKFKNKLFMPASEARYFVLIEDVYPQRLQYISEDDAVSEGIGTDFDRLFKNADYQDYLKKQPPRCRMARHAFRYLIDSMSGKGTWDKNPWVWVYVIKLVDKPDRIKTDEGYYPKSFHNDA